MSFSTDVRITSAFYEGGDNANALDMIPGRVVWDVGAAWTPAGGWRITLQLLNVLDDRTPTNVFYGGWYPSGGLSLDLGVAWSY